MKMKECKTIPISSNKVPPVCLSVHVLPMGNPETNTTK